MGNRRINDQKFSHDQLEAVFSSMIEGMVVQDPQGRVLLYNTAALKYLAITAEQLLGKESFDPSWKSIFEDGTVVMPDKHPATIAQKTGIPQTNVPMGVYRPDGELRWYSASAVPLFMNGDRTQEPYQVVITFRDITEERKSREALEQKEREVSTVMNTVPVMIAYWNSDLHNVLANRRYGEVFGIPPEKIKGRRLVDVIGDDIFKTAQPYIQAALQGEPSTFELEIPRFDGSIQSSLVSYLPDFHGGKVHGFFTLVTDVTKLKTLEGERRELELKFVMASKMSALGEMAAGIAHEINNPLAIINGKTALLQMRLEKGVIDMGKFNADLEMISSTVERIAKTVRGLLSFSRNADAEKMASTNVRNLIDGTLDLCREKMKNRGVELKLEVDSNVYIDCRANQITQILINLINNACDAIESQENPWLKLRVDSLAETIRIHVIDSGVAIPPETAEKIMNPFFTTKEAGKGTGLGLSISKGLAENHGGKLSYDRGSANTCFVLELPIRNHNESEERKVS